MTCFLQKDEKLNPCRFCGRQPRTNIIFDLYYIQCHNCDNTTVSITRRMAIENWNEENDKPTYRKPKDGNNTKKTSTRNSRSCKK